MKEWLRSIPSIHELQMDPEYTQITEEFGIDSCRVHHALTDCLNQVRDEILKEKWQGPPLESRDFLEWVWRKVRNQISAQIRPKLKKVINATGTVLHTNDGSGYISYGMRLKLSEYFRRFLI